MLLFFFFIWFSGRKKANNLNYLLVCCDSFTIQIGVCFQLILENRHSIWFYLRLIRSNWHFLLRFHQSNWPHRMHNCKPSDRVKRKWPDRNRIEADLRSFRKRLSQNFCLIPFWSSSSAANADTRRVDGWHWKVVRILSLFNCIRDHFKFLLCFQITRFILFHSDGECVLTAESNVVKRDKERATQKNNKIQTGCAFENAYNIIDKMDLL